MRARARARPQFMSPAVLYTRGILYTSAHGGAKRRRAMTARHRSEHRKDSGAEAGMWCRTLGLGEAPTKMPTIPCHDEPCHQSTVAVKPVRPSTAQSQNANETNSSVVARPSHVCRGRTVSTIHHDNIPIFIPLRLSVSHQTLTRTIWRRRRARRTPHVDPP